MQDGLDDADDPFDPEPIEGEETVKVIRAAIAYSGFELKEVSDLTGIKVPTLRNYTSKARPTYAGMSVRLRIAKACGFPEWAMREGLHPDGDPQAELRALRALVRDQGLRLSALELADRRRSAATNPQSRRSQ